MVRAAGVTDVGKVRQINQDSFEILEDQHIYIVADGMGGHAAGDQASRIAVKTINEILSAYDFSTEALDAEENSPLAIEELIRYALQEANEQILLASLSNQHLQGMGTTAIVAIAYNGSVFIGHVGDSRTYLIRNQQLSQLTEDHSVVQQLVRAGAISEEEAAVHPYKNVITRCLGMQANVEPDTMELVLQPGDRILMCSDGLSNMVTNATMQEVVLANEDPLPACEKLIALANENGGTDNITVLLLYND
ncbi:serine/threonine protein phosphatase [bacterium (Candidatus Blackallbacteria) CG17_big_fil_post_rev_8_21_14_2_50_48_46]|uniref:Serine/threonine protein phosphatase n=1 Tax=bacterium (Candidatus Blackallbacteria) CG17_big_fil_post_rev_8_21_14_2_50_48_46 TaxID=2014261 RepID=A0A2M7G547_9BACT|nr:MAG: hypothetical protein COW64_20310 [bacterium (Candidatus Blackallbacteria) CG18_big_fil_WC_8_21_14_2_50_49_26]PIW17067.1 MAG: serine/threonine protein phosphatase [bacterium (Candidatus Blackallbacteria) CG17_big_fil_post_rev_8_21_14_2_50_48_46]PIW47698.1 MAG: serine/threonine protein phosphatase [bacterium (Candidatus Blackallbacteria) CG13_big_fil_rev_8_21_14_2_50_49_14]